MVHLPPENINLPDSKAYCYKDFVAKDLNLLQQTKVLVAIGLAFATKGRPF